MSSASISYFDHHLLNQQKIEDCHLSIEMGLNNFTYCIIYNRLVLAIEQFEKPLSLIESSLKTHLWLSKTFKSIDVCIVDNKTTIVPESLYESTNKSNYLSLNHKKTEHLEIISEKINCINSYNIYGVNKAIKNIIKTYFQNATIQHHTSSFLTNVLNQHKNSSEKKIIINSLNQKFQMVILDQNELLFFNTYFYQNPNDFIYNILFAVEQLKLDPEQIRLILYGNISENSEIYKLIYTYIRNVEFGKRNKQIILSPVIDHIEDHNCFSVLHQHLCV